MSPGNHSIPLAESQDHVINRTNLCRALDDGVEDGLHVRRRAADNPEHLGRCSLVLQGLTQFCIVFLYLLEQPDVLDGNHRLVCKSPKKSDLLVSEGVYFHSTNTNSADRNTLSHQRHRKSRPGTTTAATHRLFALREFLFGFSFDVMDMYRLAVDDGAAGYRTPIDGQRHRWQWPV